MQIRAPQATRNTRKSRGRENKQGYSLSFWALEYNLWHPLFCVLNIFQDAEARVYQNYTSSMVSHFLCTISNVFVSSECSEENSIF